MGNKKLGKRFMAVILSAMLLVPAPAVSAAEQPSGSQEGSGTAESGSQEGGTDVGGGTKNVVQPGGTEEFVADESGILTAYNGKGGEITIPAKVGDADVTGIDGKIFNEKKQELTKVTILANITEISDALFNGCANLEEVVFPESLTKIGGNAFSGCVNLANVEFPENLNEIGINAFSGCAKLANVEFPENLKKIGYSAFRQCTSLSSIHFPLKTNFIEYGVFESCTALERITFQDGESSQQCNLSYGAFEGCTSLTSVVFPAVRYVYVAGSAFRGCTSLTEFQLAGESSKLSVFDGCLYDNVTTGYGEEPRKELAVCPAGKTEVEFLEGTASIRGGAFSEGKLISVEIPDTVTEIGDGAFSCCEALTKAVLPQNLKEITSNLFCYTAITEIKIPETIRSIGSYAFDGCGGLKTVTIPCNTEYAGEMAICQAAFRGCTALESVYLQEGVRRIDQEAFQDCTSLKTLEIPESVTSIFYDAFGNTTGSESTETLTIYGKAGSYAETYAKNQNINFSTEQPPQPPSGGKPEEEIYDISNPAFIVTLDAEVFDYDGKEKEPDVTIKKGETLLTPGADFTIDYVDNVNPGTAKVIVQGRRKYSGEVTKEFTIRGIDISGTDFTITLSETKYTCDGTAKQPAVTVTKGTEKLRGTDFTVKYENNINPGTAKAIVTGVGIYTGTVTKEFTIEPAQTAPDRPDTPSQEKKSTNLTCKKAFVKKYGDKSFSLQAKAVKGAKITYKSSDKKVAEVDKKGKVTIKGTGIATITVTAAATGYETKTLKTTVKVSPSKGSAPSLKVLKGRKLKVSWKKDKRATGYQVQYCISKAFKKGVKTIPISKNKTITKTISKLANGKRYYVRVRAYKNVKVNKKTQKLYGPWSNVKRSGKIGK